jgi:uncharacterized protein
MAVPVDVGHTLAFGDDIGDAEFDPDSVEVLPLMAHIDLAELVEEEVLLSLPMLPRHEDCELPGPAGSGRQPPFAVLRGRVDTGGASLPSPTNEND